MEEVTIQQLDELIQQEEFVCLYVYTPMCGTCQLANRMVSIVQELVSHVAFRKSDINYMPDRAVSWEIESVPCLLLFRNGEMKKKLYAFQSVPYLYEVIQELQKL
ncbi:thioredoxin family protein [Anoxybacillus rupiensis]|uniref:Thioredoxin family protein n=1 Tax=Anoxybacteroides rupiense TaxID=311460 RepID=A0ABT5W6H0_9BACL|nr:MULTISPECIES: thioredoxin family protein [Anoxybacillus]MBS2772278.1 thioredoxin family protein [Anoxybacillus rupiensis]MDE8564932.1 thioredoxin family protein [Anoxybacillus rupiensis]QHC05245.1 thioredoxin [Anoxybacillus sp. PDR2]